MAGGQRATPSAGRYPHEEHGSISRFRAIVHQFIADVGHEEECLPTAKRFFLSSSPTMIGYPSSLPILIRSAINLLHCDPMERFSVVSFVWAPGQKTPVHDHTVWGMVGVMRGVEFCEEFSLDLLRVV